MAEKWLPFKQVCKILEEEFGFTRWGTSWFLHKSRFKDRIKKRRIGIERHIYEINSIRDVLIHEVGIKPLKTQKD